MALRVRAGWTLLAKTKLEREVDAVSSWWASYRLVSATQGCVSALVRAFSVFCWVL